MSGRAGGVPLVAFAVMMTVMAGCVGDDDPAGAGDPLPSLPGEPISLFPIDNTASKCREGFVVPLISFAQAASSLPEGFEPADAQGLLNTPVATGLAAAFFTTFACEVHGYGNGTHLHGDLGILVQAPDIPNLTATPLNFYVVHSFTDQPALVTAMNATGYALTAHAPEITMTILPTGGARVDATLHDAEGVAATYHIDAMQPDSFTTHARFWHDTPAGLTYWEYELSETPIAQGGATCTLRTGSVFAEVVGRTDCPAQSTIAMTVNDGGWASSFQFLAGVHAAA